MPFLDLNVPYTSDHVALAHTLAFHHELGYKTVAVSVSLTGKLSSDLPKIPIPAIRIPQDLKVLTRLNFTISDISQNYRLATVQPSYDILALRPTTEKTLQACCGTLDCDLVSLDFSSRLPFILKFKTVASAIQRGVRFEICYSVGIMGGSDARRNLISGATSLIRATRGRGIIISSEARDALGVRGPWDVINLAQIWGLGQERGKEALCEEAGKVVRLAEMKRRSYRGVVNIVDGEISHSTPESALSKEEAEVNAANTRTQSSQKMKHPDTTAKNLVTGGTKRKASLSSLDMAQSSTQRTDSKPLSKTQMKKQAKKARLEANASKGTVATENIANGFPIQHESLPTKTR